MPLSCDISERTTPRNSGSATETWHDNGARYFYLAIVFLLLNTVSSLLFIHFVRHPVFDDSNYLPDVHRYAREGVSVDTIRRNIMAPGPTSFIWMAAAVRALGGDELRDARLACVASWLAIGVIILFGARYTHFPEPWYAALLFTLVLPHTLTATATIRAEGPAMVFALWGALAWTESVSRSTITPRVVLFGLIGGLVIGLAIDGRQYYLAMLAAAGVYAMYRWRELGFEIKSLWLTNAITSLVAACIPVLLLILIWKGLSSPGMATGTSYGTWVSRVGPNPFRPSLAAFYIVVYLFPLSFPAIFCLPSTHRWRAAVIAVLCGIGAANSASFLLQPGPLNTFIEFVGRTPVGEHLVLGLITAVAIYNAIGFGYLIWQNRVVVKSCPPVVFAMLVLVFFIGEQFGVSGNLPFYEIYILQIAPFLGLAVFAVLPNLTVPRVATLVFLSVISQGLLWRHALGA
jgi:hypothetical protein